LKKSIDVYLRSSAVALLALLLGASIAPALAQGNAKRGEYLAKAGGCLGCHTETKDKAVPYAGGRELKTPFGTFYGPNITPDPKAGIGKWNEEDFIRAMRHGRRPDGANYFPAFPYPSFTKIRENDLRDLWAYLQSLPQSSQPSRPHDLGFFYRWRFLVTIWKWLYFTPGAFTSIPGASDVVNRGAYLVQALGHCGECHTPRNFLGGPKSGRYLAGGKVEGKDVPNLTPTGLKKWSDRDLQQFLVAGMTPDGDFPSEAMAEVITNTTSKVTPEDLAAMVAYLRSLPPLPD
jgi:mono/diheme cytochrome c family protein